MNATEYLIDVQMRSVVPDSNIFGSDMPNTSFVHKGFNYRFLSYRNEVNTMINDTLSSNKFVDYDFVVVGHSLGKDYKT